MNCRARAWSSSARRSRSASTRSQCSMSDLSLSDNRVRRGSATCHLCSKGTDATNWITAGDRRDRRATASHLPDAVNTRQSYTPNGVLLCTGPLRQRKPSGRCSAVARSVETSSVYSTPVAAHIRGYIEVGVNPGIVLISLTVTAPSSTQRHRHEQATPRRPRGTPRRRPRAPAPQRPRASQRGKSAQRATRRGTWPRSRRRRVRRR